jgi:Receptor family ligand binding region
MHESALRLILSLCLVVSFAITSKKVLRIGAVLPVTQEPTNSLNANGPTATAVFAIAMKELKAAVKQTYNVTLQFAVRDSKRRYGRAAEATVELETTALGSNAKVHCVVGAGDNSVSEAIANVCNDYDLGQVAYGSNAAYLGSGSKFPNFVRVYPSDGYEAYALADMIGNLWGWTRVVIVYTTDDYGSLATKVFQYRAQQLGIKTVATIQITPGQAATPETQKELAREVSRVADVDGRIWVLLSDDQAQVKNFFKVAQSILSINTYFFGNSWVSNTDLFSTGLSYEFMDTIMAGFTGVQRADHDWMVTSTGKKFISKLRSQPATAWIDPATGKHMCSSATDDSGVQKLYQVQIANGSTVCIGMDYSSLAADGSSIPPIVGYLYDAVYLTVTGTIDYCRATFVNPDGSWYIPDTIDGGALSYWFATRTNFTGLTGYVDLSTGIPSVSSFKYMH